METSERNIEANMNELIGRIEAKYEKMSKGQKRLAEYVKENYDKAVFSDSGASWRDCGCQ